MKTTKQILVIAVMLMISMNLMAQRSAMTFTGTISGFPGMGSSEVTLTIQPTGDFVFDVKGSDRVSAFSFSGSYPAAPLYDMPGADGQKGVKSTSYVWALPVKKLTAFETKDKQSAMKFQPSTNAVKGNATGRTGEKYIDLKVVLSVVGSSGPMQLPLDCQLKK